MQVDDETGMVTRMVGFDERELTSKQGGKPAAIAQLRGAHACAERQLTDTSHLPVGAGILYANV